MPALLQLEALFPSDQMSSRSLRRFIANPRACFIVAEAGSRLLGNLLSLTRVGSRKARIYSVIVDPDARGMGIAQKLVSASEVDARKRGCVEVFLEVRADNVAARSLYGKLGYELQLALPGYYEDGSDGLRLAKRLNRS